MQVVLPMLNLISKEVPFDLLLQKLTTGPRSIVGKPQAKIEKGQLANLTLFNPKTAWSFDSKTNLSKSQNSPLFGSKVTGKVLAVFNNGQHVVL